MSNVINTRRLPREKPEDCLACRLTGAAAFSGLGVYALYQANSMGTFQRMRPPGSPLIAGKITAVLGLVFVSLGLGRLVI
ncbi:hypothetical protein M231_00192 [Tremella mesenterica]|uniref:Distal membrane-arm assembly complex protein 1-like domain-containing protein n=1 Tax=Tremella mesenterica TaxID=5217 RepID=A0A4Q1BWV2_TREME|nr:hypothetical protein M231_00192 [Tremella mesenterica]